MIWLNAKVKETEEREYVMEKKNDSREDGRQKLGPHDETRTRG